MTSKIASRYNPDTQTFQVVGTQAELLSVSRAALHMALEEWRWIVASEHNVAYIDFVLTDLGRRIYRIGGLDAQHYAQLVDVDGAQRIGFPVVALHVQPTAVPTDTLRVFLAHPKGWSDTFVAACVTNVDAIFQRHLAGDKHVQVITSREAFREKYGERDKYPRHTWDEWAQHVGAGTRLGEPLYHVIVVPWEEEGVIGAGTSPLLRVALTQYKPVIAWDATTQRTARVERLEAHPDGGWSRGWKMICSGGPL